MATDRARQPLAHRAMHGVRLARLASRRGGASLHRTMRGEPTGKRGALRAMQDEMARGFAVQRTLHGLSRARLDVHRTMHEKPNARLAVHRTSHGAASRGLRVHRSMHGAIRVESCVHRAMHAASGGEGNGTRREHGLHRSMHARIDSEDGALLARSDQPRAGRRRPAARPSAPGRRRAT
jgi:hypothetical protein